MALHHMLRAAAGNVAGPSDPYFYDVSLLLTGDGTNGAQNNTFLDSSTNNFTITRNGNTTQGTFSPYGSLWSNYFDGIGDYLSLASNSAFGMGTGNFTIEFWFYAPSISGDSYIVQTGSAGANTLYVSFGSSTLRLTNAATVFATTPTLVANTWYHIAVQRSGTSSVIYTNGVAGTAVSCSIDFQQAGLFVGANNYSGYISNLRVIKGTALYTSNFTPSTTPLTAVSGTSLLTCQSNRFIDNSSNNFTLTVNGNTSVQRFSPFNPTAPYSAATIGGSGYFDGTGDSLQAPSGSSVSGTGDFTIEYWAYIPSFGSSYKVMYANDTSGAFASLINSTGTVSFGRALTAVDGTTSNTVQFNAWNHIAFCRSSGTMRMFINGVSGYSAANTTNFVAGVVRIGTDGGGSTFPYLGYFSDVRSTNNALYTTNFTPSTTPLTAVSGTALLCGFTNAGIPDAAMMNDLETAGNAQVSTSVKKYGTGSLAFDGTGDYVLASSNPVYQFGTGDFTIEAWLYPTTLSGFHTYVATRTDTGSYTDRWTATVGTNGQVIFYSNSAIVTSANYAVPLNTWTHVAITRSGTTVKCFINGTQSGSSGTNSQNFTHQILAVGANSGGTSELFIGYIDDLRITKGYARYTANFTAPTAALPTY